MRNVLEELARDKLLEALDARNLAVTDQRNHALMIEALGESLANEIVFALPQDRLKELYHVLDLDDSGCAKPEIVEPIVAGVFSQRILL